MSPKPRRSKHACDIEPELSYTIDDDGVWLRCEGFYGCGFAWPLGHFSTVADAQAARAEHGKVAPSGPST